MGGDLRIAHFFGIHAEQAIPLVAFATAGLPAAARWATLLGGRAVYSALTIAVFLQAVAARALIPA